MKTSLESAIEIQLANLQSLKELLEKELHLISSREPETLTHLLQGKQQVLESIESQDSAIETLYKRASDKGNIPEACEQLLGTCKSVLAECKYLTQINANQVLTGRHSDSCKEKYCYSNIPLASHAAHAHCMYFHTCGVVRIPTMVRHGRTIQWPGLIHNRW